MVLAGSSWLKSDKLTRLPWLAHAFGTRAARSLGSAAFAGGFGVARLKQIHSATIYQVVKAGASRSAPGSNDLGADLFKGLSYVPAGSARPALAGGNGAQAGGAGCEPAGPASAASPLACGDALVTAERGVLLTVRTADCLPVLLADRRLRVIAAIHAGWRGTLARIVEKTVGEMRRLFNSRPQDVVAALGPSIGSCCYEVGEEVVDAFHGQFADADRFFRQPAAGPERDASALRYTMLFHTQAPPGHGRERARLHLDLAAAARAQLLAAGLKPAAIDASPHCTACRAELFFSYRRQGLRAGRMVTAIGLRS